MKNIIFTNANHSEYLSKEENKDKIEKFIRTIDELNDIIISNTAKGIRKYLVETGLRENKTTMFNVEYANTTGIYIYIYEEIGSYNRSVIKVSPEVLDYSRSELTTWYLDRIDKILFNKHSMYHNMITTWSNKKDTIADMHRDLISISKNIVPTVGALYPLSYNNPNAEDAEDILALYKIVSFESDMIYMSLVFNTYANWESTVPKVVKLNYKDFVEYNSNSADMDKNLMETSRIVSFNDSEFYVVAESDEHIFCVAITNNRGYIFNKTKE